MNVLINIGNTHTQVGMEESGTPHLLATYSTPEIINGECIPLLEETKVEWHALASSVVPKATHALQKRYGKQMLFLTADDFPTLDLSLMDTSTLGIDRICNAAAALAAVGHGPVAVFDFGTCIASAVIDSRNRLLGGVIAPGRRLLRFALHEHTAQLPNIPLQAERPEAIGNNTLKAMVAGTDLGILGTARFLVEETRKALNAPHCTVFATGGDAPYFLKNLDGLSQAPELLTLRGIISARPAM